MNTRTVPFQREVTSSPEQTQALGAALATHLHPGDLIALEGDLGSGKTCLIQGLCRALGVTSRVNSPTFVLINEYDGRRPGGEQLLIRHFDLYRLSGSEELEEIGVREFFHDPESLCFVEWADRVPDLLPAKHWSIEMSHLEDPADRQGCCRWVMAPSAAMATARGSEA